MEQLSTIQNISAAGVNYQVKVSNELEDPEWDDFVSSLSHGHHVQSSMWSQVKSILGYRSLRIAVFEEGQIVAGVQMLIRNLMPFVSIAYMPKGPIFSEWNLAVAEIIVEELKRIAKTNHFLVAALQPPVKEPGFKSLLESHGFQPSWMELAPTATIYHDLTQDRKIILKEMRRQTSQNIRRSERDGITIREGTEEDIPVFYKLHLATSERQGFAPYSEDYFIHLWKVFSKQDLISLIFAEYEDQPVSALLLISFGEFVTPKILGWSGAQAKRRPNDAAFWAAMQWAQNRGYHYFDMGGINRRSAEITLSGQSLPEEFQRSPDFFKLGFGGSVKLLSQSYHFVPNAFWRWPYYQIFGAKRRGHTIYRKIVPFLKRFG